MVAPATPAPSPAPPLGVARILVVDDEAAHRDSLRRIFERAGHAVACAKDGVDAKAYLDAHAVDVVLTDLVMPGSDGFSVLDDVKQRGLDTDVVLMTAYGNVENAVQAMRRGAADFLTKPTRRGELLACLDRVLERRRLLGENRALRAEIASVVADGADARSVRGLDRLVSASTSMTAVKALLAQAAKSNAPVLLVGEPGTGKELCGRALHELSPRKDAPFVVVHAAGVSIDDWRARVARARGGTLFIEEVAELAPALQVALLRLVQDGAIDGEGDGVVDADVRVVAASTVEVAARVKEGRFREDLSWALDVVGVRVPPLREREGDVPVLAAAFLQIHAARHGRSISSMEPEAKDALSSWSFPGNVRELSHAIERAVVLCPDGLPLRFDDLPPALRAHHGDDNAKALTFRIGQMSLPQMERAAIDATMVFCAGDKVQAAKLLGLSLRTLYRRLGEKPALEHDDDE